MGWQVAGSRLTVAMASPCSGRMKLDSSVSMALTSHSASTAQHRAQRVKPKPPSLGRCFAHLMFTTLHTWWPDTGLKPSVYVKDLQHCFQLGSRAGSCEALEG